MAQNPLLGKRISLISKKNIRYEGLLYSINEQNATVALQNVRSFGTEGRDLTDADTTHVAPSDAVHPFLMFRGQDIKDLHVHESQDAEDEKGKDKTNPAAAKVKVAEAVAAKAPVAAAAADPPALVSEEAQAPKPRQVPTPKAPTQESSQTNTHKSPQQQQQQSQSHQGGRGNGNGGNRRQRKPNTGPAVGTGASLLTRKARGVVPDGDNTASSAAAKGDFDFQSHNDQFAKETAEDDEAGDEPAPDNNIAVAGIGTYEKDNFFDSISCDALDKQSGVDNRLRGQQERHLNTETFGAVALNNNRRRGGRGRGRGRGGGRDNNNNHNGGGGRGGRGGYQGEGRTYQGGEGSGRGGYQGGRGGGRGRGRGGGGGGRNSSSSIDRNNSGAGAQQSRYTTEAS